VYFTEIRVTVNTDHKTMRKRVEYTSPQDQAQELAGRFPTAAPLTQRNSGACAPLSTPLLALSADKRADIVELLVGLLVGEPRE
jgi:hypothetical protein